MSEEEFNDDDVELADDLDDDDLDDDDVIEADDDIEIDLDDEIAVEGDVLATETLDPEAAVVEPVADITKAAEPRADDEEDEDGLDLDEEHHPDDVEAPLDALLKERTAAAKLEDDEEELEEEEVEIDDKTGEGPTKIMPRRPGEFLCSSCFLVLPRNQLVDEERMLCRDCA
jgi:hypothetical protein